MFGWFKKAIPFVSKPELQMKGGQVAFLKPVKELCVGDLLIDGRRVRSISKYPILNHDRIYFEKEYGTDFYYDTKVWIIAERELYGDEFVDGLAAEFKEDSRP